MNDIIIKSNGIAAFLNEVETKIGSIKDVSKADLNFIEVIYLMTIPKNRLLIKNVADEIDLELAHINRWKDIKDRAFAEDLLKRGEDIYQKTIAIEQETIDLFNSRV